MLGVYYATKFSDIERIVGSGSTILNIITTNVTEASNSWDGAVGFFCGSSTSSALRGMTFHVKSWDKATNRLTLAQPLPTPPVAGDKFRMFVGGKAASQTEVLCMKVSGKQPEVETVTGTNITGVTLKKVSPILGEGTLEIAYTYSNRSLKIRLGTGDYGPDILLSTNATNLIIYNRDLAGYIVVDVTYASLPTVNRNDTYTMTFPKGNMIPNQEGYETNDGVGRTRYHLFPVRNKAANPFDAMTALSFWTGKPAGTSSTCSSSYSASYTTPQAITVANASDWPARGFWVRNKTANSGLGDLRYVDYRSGNILYTKPVNWGKVVFQNGSRAITPGMVVTGTTAGDSAVVDQVALNGGTWTGGNATGILYLKKFSGDFSASENISVEGFVSAVAQTASVKGFRGCTAAYWQSGNVVEPASDIDIGVNVPSGGFYKDPENETVAPESVEFGYYDSKAAPLIVEALLGGDNIGLWVRETILDGTQARQDCDGSIAFEWF